MVANALARPWEVMNKNELADSATEETGSVTSTHAAAETKRRSFLRVGRRDLSEDELATPVTCRFLIADVERQEEEIEDLREKLKDYDAIKVENTILHQQSRRSFIIELSSYGFLSIGSAGLGASIGYIPISSLGWVFFGLSILLVGFGIAVRVMDWQVPK